MFRVDFGCASVAKPIMKSAHRDHKYPHKLPSFGLELCFYLFNS